MRKIKLKLALPMLPLALITLVAINWVIFGNLNETIALIIILSCMIGFAISMYRFKSKTDKLELRKTFNIEGDKQQKVKKIFRFLLFAAFLVCLSISYIYEINFTLISSIIFFFLFLNIGILQNKVLVVDYKGIRIPLRWNWKWSKVKSYKFNKTTNIFSIENTDGKIKQLAGIDKEKFEAIEILMRKYQIMHNDNG